MAARVIFSPSTSTEPPVYRRAFLTRTAAAAAGLGVLRWLPACRPAVPTDARFLALRDRYFLRTLALNPVTSTYLGGDGYSATLVDANGRLRDYRPEAIAEELRFYGEVRRDLEAIDPAALAPQARVDYAVLGAQLAFLQRQYGERRYHERAIDTYVAEPFRGVDWQIQQMADDGSGLLGIESEWQAALERVRAIPAYLAAARVNLLAGKADGNLPDYRLVERDGIQGSRANATYFRATLPDTFQRLARTRRFYDALSRPMSYAGEDAADAYEGFAAFLQGYFTPADTTDRFAVGEPEYAWRVRHVLRDGRDPAALYAYGAEKVAIYEAKIFQVAEEVARGARLGLRFGSEGRAAVRRVMDWLAKDAPRDDAELFRWYREAGARAVDFGREQAMFDIPADYRLDVVETPPVLRSTIDAAYYPAPPFKHSGVGRFYLTPTGNDRAALRLNNRASVADTAVHEGFPGHDWHFKYMTEHAAQISNSRWLTPGAVEDSSSMWEDSMAAEGWALYAEELMAEPVARRPHGFYTAAEHLYELQGQLLRAVRVRVDVGIHTGRMTYDQAADYYTEHVEFLPGACARAAHDPAARAVCDKAQRAIYRYSKWPTQAITYNLGKNAILDLRERYRAARGPAYSAKAFHEKLLGMGTIPAGYYAEEFLKQ